MNKQPRLSLVDSEPKAVSTISDYLRELADECERPDAPPYSALVVALVGVGGELQQSTIHLHVSGVANAFELIGVLDMAKEAVL